MRRNHVPDREMTKRDWMALSLVFKLWTQIVEHGEQALWDFVGGISEARRRHTLSDLRSNSAGPETPRSEGRE